MKKAILFLTTIFAFSISFSQKKDEIIEYTTQDGTHYTVGDTVRFGVGSRQDNNYDFVFSPPNFLNSNALPWSPIINGKFTIIDKIRKFGSESRGYTYMFDFKEKGYMGGTINIEMAILKGEVITPASKLKKEQSEKPIIIQQNQSSLADELKKLKELLDAGILTQAEFDAQKKKLLEAK